MFDSDELGWIGFLHSDMKYLGFDLIQQQTFISYLLDSGLKSFLKHLKALRKTILFGIGNFYSPLISTLKPSSTQILWGFYMGVEPIVQKVREMPLPLLTLKSQISQDIDMCPTPSLVTSITVFACIHHNKIHSATNCFQYWSLMKMILHNDTSNSFLVDFQECKTQIENDSSIKGPSFLVWSWVHHLPVVW